EWSGSAGEEFAPDKSASAGLGPAEPPAGIAGGPSRRNGSGATAPDKNGCNFPRRRQPNRASKNHANDEGVDPTGVKQSSCVRPPLPVPSNPEGIALRLTGTF